MNLHLWDEEVKAIASDLEGIRVYHNHTKRQQRYALISYKVAILQLQGLLSTLLEKLAHATQRKSALPPAARSLVHWGGIMSQKIHQYYFLSVQLEGKTMWLNLLRSRIPGNHHAPNENFSDEHLVELANRLTRLSETEEVLEIELRDIQRRREQLEYRYQDLCTIEQNRAAAVSMSSNFGTTLKNALAHPTLDTVRALFWSISRRQLQTKRKDSYLSDLHQTVERRTEQMIQNCRHLVVDNMRNPSRRVRKREIDQYRENLNQISELQQQLADASALLLEPPPAARPILLKNHQNSGTTLLAR